MKTKYDNIFWGILLILAAGLTLAQQQGWVGQFTPQFWMLVFAGLAFVFFIRYLLAGLIYWGWLFPVCIFLALGGMLWLGTSNFREAWIAAPFFGAIAIPFLIAFAVNFRKHWWALIPAFVMIICGSVIVFENQASGEVIGSAFMFAIAIPFLAVYLTDRKNWWAIIPAFTMSAIGTLILLSRFLSQWAGAFVTLAISLPFFYVYFKQERRWWALIPAGIMASIGINALLTVPLLGRFAQSSIPTGVMFLGWAATFGWLWRQRGEKSPTDWARFPAMICSTIATILLVVGSLTMYGLTIALILAGMALIYVGLRPRKEKQIN
jgi:hypothetical protein